MLLQANYQAAFSYYYKQYVWTCSLSIHLLGYNCKFILFFQNMKISHKQNIAITHTNMNNCDTATI